MLIKIKYVGINEVGAVTQNQDYTILDFDGNSSGNIKGIIIDDNGHLYVTTELLTNLDEWQLVSVSDGKQSVIIFP